MSNKQHKTYMPHYLTMSVFIACGALAFKLSGYVSMISAIGALLLANPALVFPRAYLRWLIIVLLCLIMVYFFPDLMQLKTIADAT